MHTNLQARFGVEVLEHHACFFVALKLMFQTTYIDESNGSKCCVFKGDPAKASCCCNFTHTVALTGTDMHASSSNISLHIQTCIHAVACILFVERIS